jgi:uncharacterized protein
MRHILRFAAGAILLLPILAAGAGLLMRGFLHPARRPLDAALIADADQTFHQLGATREDMSVSAPDGVLLRGWKVRPQKPNGDWVLLFHGVSDNRAGMLPYAALLLRHGYGVVMMDARDHGESGGTIATYGWKERYDTQSIVNALYSSQNVHLLFALGESMGAAIALQSAAIEPRIAGVVAESSFRDLREVAYDYAGLEASPWLGKTLFRPAVWTALPAPEKEGGFKAEDVSPEKAVAARAFPILLICDKADNRIPCRHSRAIFQAAAGPKELWQVPGAPHTGAYGTMPAEFESRVIAFLDHCREP